MSAVSVQSVRSEAPLFAGRRSVHNAWARAVNRVMIGLCWACAVATIVALFLILGYVVYRGITSINLDFFTKLPQGAGEAGGMRNCIAGTMVLIAMASVMGVPVGMLCGIYLAEYARENPFTHFVRLVVDVLAGIPSILIGVLAYGLVVKGWTPIEYGASGWGNALSAVPNAFVGLRNTLLPNGPSAWAGAVALGFLMCPIIARTTEEMLKLVPQALREASTGLGAARFQTLFRVVIPAASSGIITGIMLAIARVAGETAPLLLTIGLSQEPVFHFDGKGPPIDLNNNFPSLPRQIFDFASSPYPEWIKEAWAGMLVLIVIVLVMNVMVRVVTARKMQNMR